MATFIKRPAFRMTAAGRARLAKLKKDIGTLRRSIVTAQGRALDDVLNPVRDLSRTSWRGASFIRRGMLTMRRAFARLARYRRRKILGGSGWTGKVGTSSGSKGLGRIANVLDPGFTHRTGKFRAGRHIRGKLLRLTNLRLRGFDSFVSRRLASAKLPPGIKVGTP